MDKRNPPRFKKNPRSNNMDHHLQNIIQFAIYIFGIFKFSQIFINAKTFQDFLLRLFTRRSKRHPFGKVFLQ